jgi:hypothetical protein
MALTIACDVAGWCGLSAGNGGQCPTASTAFMASAATWFSVTLQILKTLEEFESHPLRQIRSFVFNNLDRRGGFSWAMAGNDAEIHVALRIHYG